ncbi:Oidioi.mRNA.OKI2018_I69.PAR.g10597.t1.cds [Oikopleura dioica]|uniref:Oidioi.mRNA.OKI2018_I69.PAR.g10597.t1.cds n=1 Tax=Oikopleura dioica TaxID=34765 RepID=A0ABN7RYW1_OIKDI|nr:Oidioi.mRNA.OKI2018_I69.PAR.g10597.t1.cds [Oikopleura dioica]
MTEERERKAPMEYIQADKVSFGMFLLRVFTIFAGIMAIVNPYSSYFRKVLLASAAANALRLHQRVPHLTLSAQTLQNILAEDSGHYLAFSIMFLGVKNPMMIIILPLMAFAVMHSCAYFTKLSTETTLPQIGLLTKAITYIRSKNQVLLQFIAMNEIFMMPITVYLAFTGNGIFLPIMYYRFLLMRYCSERNPYNRMCFNQLNMAAMQFAAGGSCPGFARNLIYKASAMINRMAPMPAAASQ